MRFSMEIADWIVIGFLLLLSIFVYFIYEILGRITKQQTETRIGLEKIEKTLGNMERLMQQEKDEADTHRSR